jgi:hypothetical protein
MIIPPDSRIEWTISLRNASGKRFCVLKNVPRVPAVQSVPIVPIGPIFSRGSHSQVGNSVVDNADAAIVAGIIKAFKCVQQAVIAAVNRAMDDDAAIEADRLVHPLRFTKGRAFNRWIRRIGSRWKPRRIVINVELAITASAWRRRNRHPRLSVPFVDFFSGCCD